MTSPAGTISPARSAGISFCCFYMPPCFSAWCRSGNPPFPGFPPPAATVSGEFRGAGGGIQAFRFHPHRFLHHAAGREHHPDTDPPTAMLESEAEYPEPARHVFFSFRKGGHGTAVTAPAVGTALDT